MSLSVALLLIGVGSAMIAGRLQLAAGRPPLQWLTFAVMIAVGIGLTAQWLSPDLLLRFRRDAAAVAAGEPYRILTALWFQDGGLAGGAFNLAMLFLIGSVAEQLWRRWAWLSIYLGSGLACECLALWWEPVGAGNSVATLGLAGSILVRMPDHSPIKIIRLLSGVGLTAGALLAVRAEIHGAAILIGAVAGIILSRLRRARFWNHRARSR